MTIVMVSSQRLLLLSFQCSFFCHPSSPYDVIPVLLSRHPSAQTLGSRKVCL
ncbi:hypothetical protein [Wolbachia endosymbiont of Dactylopius coccus]